MSNPPSRSGLADLHRHLDGSLRAQTLQELARAAGRPLPNDIRFFPNMGLDAALARFEVTLSVLQTTTAVTRVAAEICEDAAADGVTTLEIRFAPQLHGDNPAAMVDAALEGVGGRAGVILCGLYGEAPAVVSNLVDIARRRPGVVGIDLAGGPAPGHCWNMTDYAAAFRAAAELGIGRTVHAGEGRPVAEIRTAIEQLHAQRIGHGCTLLDDPGVLELVVSRGITIEACPTSNVHTGVFDDVSKHPLATWLARGVRACVCPDNTLLSDVSASAELARVVAALELDDNQRATLIANGHAGAFARRTVS